MTAFLDNYEKLLFDFPAPRVLRITMGDPEKLTPVCAKMHAELVTIWRDIDDSEEISAVILSGGKKAFSAGGDFAIVERCMTDYHFRNQVWKETRNLVYNIINCSKPIISAMRGPAVGAGLVCGLLSDISIASKTARIIDGHTRLGVAAGDHSVIIWPLLCGMAKAKYYLLTCDSISGEEAERIGLVSLTVDDEELDAKALEVATRLSNGAPSAIRWTKNSLNNWFRMAGPAFDASVAYEMLGLTGPEVRKASPRIAKSGHRSSTRPARSSELKLTREGVQL